MSPSLLIVGGSDAGIAAALRAREVDPTAELTVVVADAYPNFSICGLPFFLSGETPDWRDLAHRTRTDIEGHGIRLLMDHRAERADADRRQAEVLDDGGRRLTLGYDRLVIGTGATPVRPALEGIDLPGVHVLHSMDDSFAVGELLARPVRSAVIIGAGYIGTEMADALTHRGLDVTLVEQLPSVLSTVDADLGGDVADELAHHGVDVATGVRIERIAREGARLGVAGSGGFARAADLVLVAVGVRPDTALAQTAGVELGVRGAVRVDRQMRTSVEGSTSRTTAPRPGTGCWSGPPTCRWAPPRTSRAASPASTPPAGTAPSPGRWGPRCQGLRARDRPHRPARRRGP